MKIQEIAKLTSSQLLDYSQKIHMDKKMLTKSEYMIIISSIDERQTQLNNANNKEKECEYAKMIKKFKRVK